MQEKKIRADLFFATFGEVSQKALGYAVLVLLGRHLDKESMGQFFVTGSIALIAAAVTEIGTGRYLVREIAAMPDRALRHLGEVLSVRLPLTACALVVVNVVVHLWDPALATVMLLTSCYVLVGDLYYSYSAFLVGQRQITLRLITLLGGQLLLALCVGASVLAGGSLHTVLLAYLAANLMALACTAIFIHRKFGAVRLTRPNHRAWQLVRAAVPFGALSAIGLLHSKADTLMLYALTSSAAVASYESAYKLLEVSRLLVRPAIAVFFPICAALAAQGEWSRFRAAYIRLLAWAGGAGVMVALLVIAFSGVLIPLIWGNRYADAVPILRILYLSVPVLYLGTVALFVAGSLHLERTALWGTASALVLNVGINLIAIPRWGAFGAAMTTFVTEALLTFWLLYLIARRLSGAVNQRSGLRGPMTATARAAAA